MNVFYLIGSLINQIKYCQKNVCPAFLTMKGGNPATHHYICNLLLKRLITNLNKKKKFNDNQINRIVFTIQQIVHKFMLQYYTIDNASQLVADSNSIITLAPLLCLLPYVALWPVLAFGQTFAIWEGLLEQPMAAGT